MTALFLILTPAIACILPILLLFSISKYYNLTTFSSICIVLFCLSVIAIATSFGV